MGAISLYAKASPDFAEKLAHSLALLKSSAASHAPLTQASSLGAEDMVVTHLLQEAGIDCSIFVLDTGMLHAETLALVGRIEERYQRKVDVYRPVESAASAFVETNGPLHDPWLVGVVEVRQAVRDAPRTERQADHQDDEQGEPERSVRRSRRR